MRAAMAPGALAMLVGGGIMPAALNAPTATPGRMEGLSTTDFAEAR
jgi:hypothetical protein